MKKRKKKNPLSSLKGCELKRAYETEAIANRAIKRIKETGGREQRAYKCKHCSAWHTTTKGAVRVDPKPLQSKPFGGLNE